MLLSAFGVIVPLCVSAASLLKNELACKLSTVSASTLKASTKLFVTLASMALFALATV